MGQHESSCGGTVDDVNRGGRGRRVDEDDETKILGIRIPETLKRRLEEVAKSGDLSVSDLVRDMIEREVSRLERKPSSRRQQ